MTDWNITVVQGGTVRRTLTFTEDDGSVMDITGWEWRCAIVGRNVNLAPVIEPTAPGTVTITIPKTMTATIPQGTYRIVVDWTDAAGLTPEQEISGTLVVRGQGAV